MFCDNFFEVLWGHPLDIIQTKCIDSHTHIVVVRKIECEKCLLKC